jgi:hypothetical protein
LIGGVALAIQLVPSLKDLAFDYWEWPAWIIGLGLVFLLAAAIGGVPGLAVPAAIIGGIGGLFYYQNVTGDWESWAYAWTLIPGFVGVGIILMHLLEGKFRKAFREGGGPIIVSLILFGIFGSFLGGPPLLSQFWPVLIILVGLWLLVRSFFRPRPEI